MTSGPAVAVGTSGYSYKQWKGSFYPEDLPAAEMLRFYSGRFPTVEINATFYRMPTPKLLAQWAEQVPEGFRFALKASQRITHMRRLNAAGEDVAYLLRTVAVLGGKLGPLLFQLPPNMKKDLARLQDFLPLLPPERYAAFEFRHESWLDEEVYAALRAHGAALCIAEEDERKTPLVATAPWGYLRLRRTEYGEADLAAWADRIRTQAWERAFVFFKHEDEGLGPKYAARFAELLQV